MLEFFFFSRLAGGADSWVWKQAERERLWRRTEAVEGVAYPEDCRRWRFVSGSVTACGLNPINHSSHQSQTISLVSFSCDHCTVNYPPFFWTTLFCLTSTIFYIWCFWRSQCLRIIQSVCSHKSKSAVRNFLLFEVHSRYTVGNIFL